MGDSEGENREVLLQPRRSQQAITAAVTGAATCYSWVKGLAAVKFTQFWQCLASWQPAGRVHALLIG